MIRQPYPDLQEPGPSATRRGMQRVASILGVVGKVVFLAGFLVVCVLGTATEIPFHLFGLPLAAARIKAWRWRSRLRIGRQ